jgi:hypothetical protein
MEGAKDRADDAQRVAHAVEVGRPFALRRIHHVDRLLADGNAMVRGAEEHLGFERVAGGARVERERLGDGVAAQAALGVGEALVGKA